MNGVINTDREQPPKPESLLRLKEVESRVALCGSQIYNLIREERFPAPIKLMGGRRSAWIESEVSAWINEQIAADRDKGTAA